MWEGNDDDDPLSGDTPNPAEFEQTDSSAAHGEDSVELKKTAVNEAENSSALAQKKKKKKKLHRRNKLKMKQKKHQLHIKTYLN